MVVASADDVGDPRTFVIEASDVAAEHSRIFGAVGFRVSGLELRVQGSGFRVQGSGFRV